MKRDSPIEWTGEAHLVTTGCDVCAESLTVAEGTAAQGVTCPDCRDAVEELAPIERDLRGSSCEDVAVRIDGHGARVGFGTWELNEHHRGSLTGSVCAAVGETTHWQVAVVHDPLEDDDGTVHTLLTLRRVEP